jgi:6-phosphogluconolactonase
MISMKPYSSAEQYASAVVAFLTAEANASIARKERAVVAVPGGSVARDVLPRLSDTNFPFDRVTFTLTDERWVPRSHPDSNEGLLRKLLAADLPFSLAGLFRADGDDTAILRELDGTVPSPDIALLGMGEDGHTASLFPHDAANAISASRFAFVDRPDARRITLTPTALKAISVVALAFRGSAKRAILNEAAEPGPPSKLPVRHILDRATIFTAP